MKTTARILEQAPLTRLQYIELGQNNTGFFRPVYEKKVYVQECKYQELAREGGQDTLQKKIEWPRMSVLPVFT